MKIYKKEEPTIIRINVKQAGRKTVHLPVVGVDIDECKKKVQEILLAKNISPFAQGTFTTVEFRESIAGENGKTTSFRIYNVSPQEVINYITEALQNER